MKQLEELFASRLPKDQFLFYLFIWPRETQGGKELYFSVRFIDLSKCIIKLRCVVTNCFILADLASKPSPKGFHFPLRKWTFKVKVILLGFHTVFLLQLNLRYHSINLPVEKNGDRVSKFLNVIHLLRHVS